MKRIFEAMRRPANSQPVGFFVYLINSRAFWKLLDVR